MFPVSDFNFVVAGIATFAATVGYACSRKLSDSLSGAAAEIVHEELAREAITHEKALDPQNVLETEASVDSEMTLLPTPAVLWTAPVPFTSAPTRKESLKRKIPHDGFDEPEKDLDKLAYPYNLANIYPNKRSRTPPTESEASTPSLTPATTLDSITSQDSVVDVQIPMVSQDPEPIIATPAPEPPRTPSPAPEQAASPRLPSPSPAPAYDTPAAASPVPALAPAVPTNPEPVVTRPVTPAPTNPFAAFASRQMASTPKPKPFKTASSGGFAAFAGSASPFASVKNPNSFHPQSPSQSPSRALGRSIWSSAPGDLKTHPNDAETADGLVKDVLGSSEKKETKQLNHALEEAKGLMSPPSTKYIHVTGEEEEDVELELKGVRLFTKRGSKPFAEGMAGHIKLLSNRKTLEERLLFRREPLWKVSMNVRVQPTVRCTYVPEENVVKIILKENVDSPSGEEKDGEEKQELVIYALKPGRSCSKQDFKDFAETLSKGAHFKSTRTRTP